MKTIVSMLAAIILALYTFCAACRYAPSSHVAGGLHGIATRRLCTYGRGVSGDCIICMKTKPKGGNKGWKEEA